MALSKNITMEDGVLCRYHRVYSVTVRVNGDREVIVRSYPTKAARAAEKEAQAAMTYSPIYARDTRRIMTYGESVDVTDAYAWLKTLPEFEGASDVLEEDDA